MTVHRRPSNRHSSSRPGGDLAMCPPPQRGASSYADGLPLWRARHPAHAMLSLQVLLAAGAMPFAAAWAEPVPVANHKVPVLALPTGNTQKSGTPIKYTVDAPKPGANAVSATITQTDANNIVDWKTFDIGASARLNIVQPSSSAVLLNKVSGGEFQNKTVIEGVLNANGRVYLYNPNGIVFGKTGTVDTASLIASSLRFDEARVVGGLLRKGDGPVLGAAGAAGPRPGPVVVEGDATGGARLTAANGGLVLLAAPQVSNNGNISAPDGQVVLAAGTKVYLAAPTVSQTGTSLRGLLVEVSNDDLAGLPGGDNTRTAENGISGRIAVGRGNATMIGYAVNQKGTVSATTSVTLNGSVYLLARDQAEVRNGVATPTRAGPLVLGPGSLTEVTAQDDPADKIPATTAFGRSQVVLNGQGVELQAGAAVVAPGGDVAIRAQRLYPQDPGGLPPDPRTDVTARVDFAPGSVVDVSGSRGTALPMSSNLIEVDLRGTELADNVVLRDSALYGSKVMIDARKGTPIAEVSGWLDQRQRGLGEVNAAGGTVSVSAGAAIIQRPGSRINVDGGWVDVLPGKLGTSQLKLGETLVDIGSAKTGVAYTEVVNLPDSALAVEPGYRQGASAGTVAFSAPIVVMQGDLSGQVDRGARQRDPTAAGFPQGGRLQIGNVTANTMDPGSGRAKLGSAVDFGYEGQLRIGASETSTLGAPGVGAPFLANDAGHAALASRLDLDTTALARGGFSRIQALTRGDVEVAGPVTLPAGGQLWLGAAPRGALNEGEVQAPDGGRIGINAPVSIPGGSFAATAISLDVAGAVSIDTAGRWVNDQAATNPAHDSQGNPTELLVNKGGAVNLSAVRLQVGEAVQMDVSAGAWLNAQGRTTRGAAGSIILEAKPSDSTTAGLAVTTLSLGDGLKLSGYGFGSGGSVRLLGREFVLGAIDGAGRHALDTALAPGFFQSGGFSSYDIGASLDLTVKAGTTLAPRAENWQLGVGTAALASGRMATAATPTLSSLSGPGDVRATSSLTLRASGSAGLEPGKLRLLAGSVLDMDPSATLNLLAGGPLELYGAVRAPAGRVTLGMNSDRGYIWLGPAASIRAEGSLARLYTNGLGISSGEVLDGGSILIGGNTSRAGDGRILLDPAPGYVFMAPGSALSVAGVNAGTLNLASGGATVTAYSVAGAGGGIQIRSAAALELLGSFNGASGGVSARAGSLTVALEAEGALLNVVSKSSLLDRLNRAGLLTPATYDGVASTGTVITENLNAGRFADLRLRSRDAIAFNLDRVGQTLTASASLALDTPTLLSDDALRAKLNADLTDAARKELESRDTAVRDKAIQELKAADLARQRDERDFTDLDLNAAATDLAAARIVDQYLRISPASTLALKAPYVQLGDTATEQVTYPVPGRAATRSAIAGNAQLSVAADNIDLKGHAALQGFAKATLSATQDIRLTGVAWSDPDTGRFDGTERGSLWIKGQLSLSSAQVYPTTLTDFTLVAASTTDEGSGRLSFAWNGQAAGPVLSAGGSLNAIAPHIAQAGHLRAPFGRIALGNTNRAVDAILTSDLTYAAGSLTSVAGRGPIPLGVVSNGSVPTASRWAAQLSDGTEVSLLQKPAADAVLPERALPAKVIVSNAASISVDSSAVLDLSGGGSMFAYGFTPGRGGSKDVLAREDNKAATVFAILPGFSGKVAPLDGNFNEGGLAAGDAVWLSGLGDLKAGLYTLLPAHYALMPGAYSVSVAAGTRDMAAGANTVQSDGSLLVAGRSAQAGSGAVAARTQGFVVSPNSVVRRKSEFALYDADRYFAAKALAAGLPSPDLPADGGHVVFDATDANAKALQLEGTVRLGAGKGGVAGLADIAAPLIEIASEEGVGAAGAVRLSAARMSALDARSLSIGAVRRAVEGDTHLDLRASSVAVKNDAAHALSAPELLLAARDSLSLAPGATLHADEASGRADVDLLVSGPGALLRAASGAPVQALRASGTNTGGVLDIASGAVVSAAGSALLDAGNRLTLGGDLQMARGAALAFAAPHISLGTHQPASVQQAGSLVLGAGLLDAFGSLSQLSFDSYGTLIDLHGRVQLGSAAMDTLSFKAAGFQGHGGTASLLADTVRLEGAAAGAANSADVPGSLAIQAKTVAIGAGTFSLHGLSDTTLSAQDRIVATARGGVLAADQNLLMAAGRFTTTAGSDASFSSGTAIRLTQVGQPLTGTTAAGMGGQLSFQAPNIASDALLTLPSGRIVMEAANTLEVRGGVLSAAGGSTSFGGVPAQAPAGSITLAGADVLVRPQARLDVSAVGAAAGSLSVIAPRQASLEGQWAGGASAAADGVVPQQGQFVLTTQQAGAAGSFGALNAKLNDAGFTESRHFRYSQGDVVLAGNDRVVAHQLAIATDNGNIQIGGNSVIDASGASGGSIELSAAQTRAGGNDGRVTLSGEAQLIARATAVASGTAGSLGDGGRVTLTSSNLDGSGATSVSGGASIRLEGGSIDVAGNSAVVGGERSRDGSITLRAPRLADGSDVAVASLATARRNASSTVIEAVKVYEASTVSANADSESNLDATRVGRMYQDAGNFAERVAGIQSRLGTGDASVRAGLEVRSRALARDASGALTVSVNEFAASAANRGWNLNEWRFAGQPVALSLRAQGNLNIVGSISDGFVKPASDNSPLAMPAWALASDSSADLRLVAGADFGAAQSTAVVQGRGDLLIDFANRTPAPTNGGAMKLAGTNQVVAANPNAPVTRTDAPVALVRTGSGRIELAAGRDVTLGLAKFYVSAVNDETLENPLVFDSVTPEGKYTVSMFGASVYSAGRAIGAPPFSVPVNALNTRYGAAAEQAGSATFAGGGGSVTVTAGRDVNGPRSLSTSWSYRNADGLAAYEGDPEDLKNSPPTPAVPGTVVNMARVAPQLVNNWLFRQGRSATDADGKVVFETLADGKTPLNTAWWVRPDFFSQGIATLGGGNVSVVAGRHANDLSLSAASNAFVPTVGAALVERGGGDVSLQVGGDVSGGVFYAQKGAIALRADGSLKAGLLEPAGQLGEGRNLAPVLALGDGQASVLAGQSLTLASVFNPTMTEQSVNNQKTSGGDFSPVYATGGAWDLTNTGSTVKDFRTRYSQFSNFNTYGAESAVRLTALGGDLTLSADAAGLATAGHWEIPGRLQEAAPTAGFQNTYVTLPPSLRATSFGGDIVTGNGVALSPSASGQLELLAAGSVRLNNGASGSLRMLDNDPAAMSTALAPRVLSTTDLGIIAGNSNALEAHTKGGLHKQDLQPARVVALTGDVKGDASAATSLSMPKATVVIAGRDIVDLGTQLQHNTEADVSVLKAGRDVVDTTQSIGGFFPSDVAHVLGGQGRLDVLAGRHVDLGNGNGFVTRGNLGNAYLPEGGAAIRVVAGVKPPDYAAYAAFVDKANRYGLSSMASHAEIMAMATYTGQLGTPAASGGGVDLVSRQQDLAFLLSLPEAKQRQFFGVAVLEEAVRQLPQPNSGSIAIRGFASVNEFFDRLSVFVSGQSPRLNDQQIWDRFMALPDERRAVFLSAQPALAQRLQKSAATLTAALGPAGAAPRDPGLIESRFFASLVETGRLAQNQSDKDANLKTFDGFIAALFPDAGASAGGDISNFGSQFKTEQGGAVTLLAPAGSVYAGLTLGYALKLPSAQGIFTVRGGEVAALVRDDFLVNKGRVFTLGGGDITLVSQRANIDAGRGSKTAASAPPPLITVDPNGNIKLDVAASIAGSGIATLKTRPDIEPGDVFAIAPRGIFDAGDAGVRSSGAVLVVAPIVLNAANISAGGAISGATVAVAAPSLGSVAAPSNASPKTDDVAKAASGSAAGGGMALSVEALGYGSAGEAGGARPGDAVPAKPLSETDSESDSEDDDKKKKKRQPDPSKDTPR